LSLDTFIKIDVESYECALVPSMVNWLLAAPLKPTLSLAMHRQVSPCNEGAYADITRLAAEYKHVECASGSRITLLANADLEAGGIGNLCSSGDLLLSDHVPPADKS
jgi:hypothetical protein